MPRLRRGHSVETSIAPQVQLHLRLRRPLLAIIPDVRPSGPVRRHVLPQRGAAVRVQQYGAAAELKYCPLGPPLACSSRNVSGLPLQNLSNTVVVSPRSVALAGTVSQRHVLSRGAATRRHRGGLVEVLRGDGRTARRGRARVAQDQRLSPIGDAHLDGPLCRERRRRALRRLLGRHRLQILTSL